MIISSTSKAVIFKTHFSRTMADNGFKFTEHNSDYIKNYLLKFKGGNIFLNKYADGIASLCIDNPEKRNAISGKMMVDFRECIEELEKWLEGKAVILHGNNGNFCSGGDLDFARASGTAQKGFEMSSWMQETLLRLNKLPLISVCLVEGPSLGGGAEISTFCDYIVAAENVKLGFVHGKMGIITAWGGTTRLVQKVGQRKALDLLLTSKILSAKESLDIGLVDYIVPTLNAFNETKLWLNPRIQHHHTVVRAFKDVVYQSTLTPFTDSYSYEKDRFSPFWGNEINKQALLNKIKHVNVDKQIYDT